MYLILDENNRPLVSVETPAGYLLMKSTKFDTNAFYVEHVEDAISIYKQENKGTRECPVLYEDIDTSKLKILPVYRQFIQPINDIVIEE